MSIDREHKVDIAARSHSTVVSVFCDKRDAQRTLIDPNFFC
jgi:hypothetical protein